LAGPFGLGLPVYRTSMGFGALGTNAKVALGMGFSRAGSATCTGEGGMLAEERAASAKLIYQMTPARYGLDPIVIVVNNGGWQIFRPVVEKPELLSVPAWPYAELARGWGGAGFRTHTVGEFRGALQVAAVVEVRARVHHRVAAVASARRERRRARRVLLRDAGFDLNGAVGADVGGSPDGGRRCGLLRGFALRAGVRARAEEGDDCERRRSA